MFGLTEQTRVFLKTGVTDGRLGIEGLRGLVSTVLQQDVLAGHVFVFCNGRRNRIRCLLWDGSGFWLATKRLERATFDWPKNAAAMSQMSLVQLRLLLEGFELRSRRGWERHEMRLQAVRQQPEAMAVRECQLQTRPVSD
jgi:transposase